MKMVEIWYKLTTRERWLVGSGAILLVFLIAYALIYAPLRNAVINKQLLLKNKQDDLAWIKRVHHLPNAKQKLRSVSPTQLLTLMTQALSQPPFSNYPYTLTQSSVNHIDLHFNQVPFNRFMTWAWKFNQQYAFDIKMLHVEKTDQPGMVKLSCVISI